VSPGNPSPTYSPASPARERRNPKWAITETRGEKGEEEEEGGSDCHRHVLPISAARKTRRRNLRPKARQKKVAKVSLLPFHVPDFPSSLLMEKGKGAKKGML